MSEQTSNDESVRILEVRNRRSSIYIHYVKGDDDYPVTFHDNPLPEFYEAIEGLKDHLVTLAEIPKADLPKIETTGITVRPKGDNAMALIVARKTLKRNKRVLNLATPMVHMYEPQAEGSKATGGDHMTDDEAAAIERVIREAKRYIAGERAQGRLALEEKPKRGKKKPAGEPENVENFPGMTEPSAP